MANLLSAALTNTCPFAAPVLAAAAAVCKESPCPEWSVVLLVDWLPV